MLPVLLGVAAAWVFLGGFFYACIKDDEVMWAGLTVHTTATLAWAFAPIALVIMLFTLLKFLIRQIFGALGEAFGELGSKIVDKVEARLR